MAKKKGRKTYKKLNLTATILFIIFLAAVALVYYFIVPKLAGQYKDSEKIASLDSNANKPTTLSCGEIEEDFKIHFVDVGQGDGIVIELPDGKNMLVDAGKKANVAKLTDYIDSLGINTFDYLIATHQDEDHIGGMKTIFDKYQVNYVFRPHVLSTYSSASELPENFNQGSSRSSCVCKTQTYYTFLKCIIDEGSQWSFFNKDSDITFEYTSEGTEYKCSFDFLTPTAEVEEIAYANNANNYSPIIRIEYCDYKVLLTGDAEAETEKEFVDFYTQNKGYLDVDLLKVGHHGSATSSSQDFLSLIKPEISVISCGVGNTYGHPTQAALERLLGIGSSIYRTDVQGTVILTVPIKEKPFMTTSITDYNEADLYKYGTK